MIRKEWHGVFVICMRNPFSRGRLLPLLTIPAAAVVIALAALFVPGSRQAPPPGPPPDLSRFLPKPPPAPLHGTDADARFVDVAGPAGLHYRWTIPGPRPIDILQGIGNGCAFLDYDNSGNLSVLLVGTDHVALYKGDGRGHFADVSHATGLDTLRGHFLGCAVGDYDNDGYDDLYLSGYRTGLLLHNEGGKRFRDVTQEAGLTPQPWGTSAAFGDVDGDGRLDLYVAGYVDYDPALPRKYARLCAWSLVEGACPPERYTALRGVLYHNLGAGRFEDVTDRWGADRAHGKGLGAAFADYDGRGRQSLAVANDSQPGDLFQNQGGRFREIGAGAGTALADGRPYSGMGLDWGDYDNDGRLDLAVGTFETQQKCVYHNLGGGLFEETSSKLGVTAGAYPYVTFGVKWLDFDNGGWLSLMIANGHVQDNAARIEKGGSYRQPPQIFAGGRGASGRGKRLLDISRGVGPAFRRGIVGRGLAVGDFDNDGRVDALVVDSEGAPLLLHNETRRAGHWLTVTLVGTRSNRDGYGALVTVHTSTPAGGLTQTRLCHADGSYLSSSDRRVHIGLGAATVADMVRVRWPDGHADTFRAVRGDRQVVIREGRTATP